jgi:hypothetical protein
MDNDLTLKAAALSSASLPSRSSIASSILRMVGPTSPKLTSPRPAYRHFSEAGDKEEFGFHPMEDLVMAKTVADQFAETFAAAGVKRIYGIVGDSLDR